MKDPKIIEHHPKPPIDKVIGTIGALIVCGALAWWLRGLKATWELPQFLMLCGGIIVCLLAFAYWWDRRAAARKANRQSGRS